MLTPLSGKDKAARVPLDYFRKTSNARKIAVLVALGVVVGGLLVSLAFGWWRDLASPGKLNWVHSAWEHDCSVCHEPLKPTSSRNGLHTTLAAGKVSDQLCMNCHAGTPHHPNHVKTEEIGSCASCHMEHRGRQSMLSKLPDHNCTRCHANLKEHSVALSGYAEHVTRFDRDHPQFSIGPIGHRKPLGEAKDPGKLKFNHKAHLTPGIRYSDRDSGGWKLANIKDPKLRERYRKEQPADKQNPNDLVELKCGSCHQLDASDAPNPGPGHTIPPRMAGEYELAVNYDQHCKACHPLTFNPALPDVEVPHHLQPPDVRRFLWGVFASQEVKTFEAKMKTDRPLPGHNITLQEKEARERIKENVGTAESFLFQKDLGKAAQFVFTGKTTCGLCHQYEGKPGAQIPSKIVPTNIPQIWYPHAMFSHRAHRAAECVACHDGALTSTTSADILIPGIENCRKCHGPTTTVAGEKRGGVRYDCVACHRYHQGDVPEAGLGASGRSVPKTRTLEEFLKGKAPAEK